ncbi:uncharacterized protein LOC144448240 [Glandiceps talaboti]
MNFNDLLSVAAKNQKQAEKQLSKTKRYSTVVPPPKKEVKKINTTAIKAYLNKKEELQHKVVSSSRQKEELLKAKKLALKNKKSVHLNETSKMGQQKKVVRNDRTKTIQPKSVLSNDRTKATQQKDRTETKKNGKIGRTLDKTKEREKEHKKSKPSHVKSSEKERKREQFVNNNKQVKKPSKKPAPGAGPIDFNELMKLAAKKHKEPHVPVKVNNVEEKLKDNQKNEHRDNQRNNHRDNHRDKYRDNHRDTPRDKHRDTSRDKHRDTPRDKHRDTPRDNQRGQSSTNMNDLRLKSTKQGNPTRLNGINQRKDSGRDNAIQNGRKEAVQKAHKAKPGNTAPQCRQVSKPGRQSATNKQPSKVTCRNSQTSTRQLPGHLKPNTRPLPPHLQPSSTSRQTSQDIPTRPSVKRKMGYMYDSNPVDNRNFKRPLARPPPIKSRKYRLDSDEESEYEDDDFIDDGPLEDESVDVSSYIKEIFGYDKSKYGYESDYALRNMEASYSQIAKEEARSTRLGIMEDLEDMKKEKEELKRRAEKQAKKGKH